MQLASSRDNSEELPRDSVPRLRATADAGSRAEHGGAAATPAPEGETARGPVEAAAATPGHLTGAEGGECCGLSRVPRFTSGRSPPATYACDASRDEAKRE